MHLRDIYGLPEMKELLKYKSNLEITKRYQNRELYLDCIQRFLTNTIDSDEMTGLFSMLWDSDTHRELSLITDETLERTRQESAFFKLVNDLFFVCEGFDDEATTYEEYDETWLKETVSMLFNEWEEAIQDLSNSE